MNLTTEYLIETVDKLNDELSAKGGEDYLFSIQISGYYRYILLGDGIYLWDDCDNREDYENGETLEDYLRRNFDKYLKNISKFSKEYITVSKEEYEKIVECANLYEALIKIGVLRDKVKQAKEMCETSSWYDID